MLSLMESIVDRSKIESSHDIEHDESNNVLVGSAEEHGSKKGDNMDVGDKGMIQVAATAKLDDKNDEHELLLADDDRSMGCHRARCVVS